MTIRGKMPSMMAWWGCLDSKWDVREHSNSPFLGYFNKIMKTKWLKNGSLRHQDSFKV